MVNCQDEMIIAFPPYFNIALPFQERVTLGLTPVEEKLNNQEAASLLKQKESNRQCPSPLTPPPPERHESKNIFRPKVQNTKFKNDDKPNIKYDAIETNI